MDKQGKLFADEIYMEKIKKHTLIAGIVASLKLFLLPPITKKSKVKNNEKTPQEEKGEH